MALSTRERVALFREKKKQQSAEHELAALEKEVYGQSPPNSKELEDAVLGGIMIDRKAIFTVVNVFGAKNPFYNAKNSVIYDCVLKIYHGYSLEIDRMILTQEIEKSDVITLNAIDFSPYDLILMCEMVSGTAHLESHCRTLLEMAICRDMISMGRELLAKAFDRQMTDCINLVANYHIGFSQAKEINFEKETIPEFCKIFPRFRSTVLFSPPKTGKSAITFSVFDLLTKPKMVDGHFVDGGNSFWFPNEVDRPANVLLFDGEMDDKDYKERGLLHSNIKRIVSNNLDMIKSEVMIHKPDFIIIDTITKYVENLLDVRSIERFLKVVDIVKKWCGVIIIAHTPKSEIGKRLTPASVYGSVKLIAACENLLSINYINGLRYLQQHVCRVKRLFGHQDEVLLLKQNESNFTFTPDRLIDERQLFYDLREYKDLLQHYQRYKGYKNKHEFAKEYGIKDLNTLNEMLKIAKKVPFDPNLVDDFNFSDDFLDFLSQ